MARFVGACRNGEYAKAAEYLNLSQLKRVERARRGPELAREFEIVTDRAAWIDLEKLSTDRDGDPNDGSHRSATRSEPSTRPRADRSSSSSSG
jgi:hypothetical protein